MSRFLFCSLMLLFLIPIANAKQIELILDASGSMRGKLSNGEIKIDAAKKAVADLLNTLPAELSVACRAYGHQSPREQHDCRDTELLTDFTSDCSEAAAKIAALQAQGYTPITYVLQRAVQDFPLGDNAKTIILISDGKETCDGDPCALADSLVQSGVNVVIHTVEFGVLQAAKTQLECIAAVTGGKYFDAGNYAELKDVLSDAVNTAQLKKETKAGLGTLSIAGADLMGHKVTNAATGEKAGEISRVNSSIELEAGIYHVAIGKAVWKSVQVKAGEKTTLTPGWLVMKNPTIRGHKILDSETLQEHGRVSTTKSSIALMPGRYCVTFRDLLWNIDIEAGQETILNPGTVTVKHADYRGHKIKTTEGVLAAKVSNTGNWAPLVPGAYTVEINGRVVPFVVAEGEDVVFDAGE